MNKRILFIVEGSKSEVQILGYEKEGLLSFIDDARFDIVSINNPIYELYEAYKKGEYDNLVEYLRTEKGFKLNDEYISKRAFSAIYLIFDYEPQYQKYSDSVIKDILRVFNDETELGKLYINYPTVEAYRHLKLPLPDKEYNSRVVNLIDFKGKDYKKIVNTGKFLKMNKIGNKEISYIIKQNYEKTKFITNQEVIDHDKILSKQIKLKNERNEIYVLSTFPFILLDYNFNLVMDKVNSIIKSEL